MRTHRLTPAVSTVQVRAKALSVIHSGDARDNVFAVSDSSGAAAFVVDVLVSYLELRPDLVRSSQPLPCDEVYAALLSAPSDDLVVVFMKAEEVLSFAYEAVLERMIDDIASPSGVVRSGVARRGVDSSPLAA